MRLWFSVAVLLVLACVVIEITEAKSSRNTETTTGNLKSGGSKGVRYSKNKSDFKKRENGKKRDEVAKGKKPYRSVEGNENNDVNESVGKNGKVSYEEQKRQKSNKQNKNSENFKNNKNIKVTKDSTSKKQKRSIEHEQTEEVLTKDSTDRFFNNEKSALQNGARNKFHKKAGNRIAKAVHDGSEADAMVDIEGVSSDQRSKETASSLDQNVENSKKSKTGAGEHHGKTKKIKQQNKSHKSEESREENVDLRKSESTEEEIQTFEQTARSKKTSESLNDSTEEKPTSKSATKDKSAKKSSKSVSKDECQGDKDSGSFSSDNQKREVKIKSKKYKSASCKSEAQSSKDQIEADTEKSEHTVDSGMGSSVVDSEQREPENEVPKSADLKLSEGDEVQESTSGVGAEICMLVDSDEEKLTEESCSTE